MSLDSTVDGIEVVDNQGIAAVVDRISREVDPATAHALEDELYRRVLAMIAHRDCFDCPCSGWAESALKASEVDFTRWYA